MKFILIPLSRLMMPISEFQVIVPSELTICQPNKMAVSLYAIKVIKNLEITF